jgi:hypothetical protein
VTDSVETWRALNACAASEYAMVESLSAIAGENLHTRNAATRASTIAPAVQYWTGPRLSVIAENGRSFQLRRSRGRADWSFAGSGVVMKYRRSALWGSTTRGTSRAVQ